MKVQIFYSAIQNSSNYLFTVKQIEAYLKIKGGELKNIWKYIPESVEAIFE